MLFFRAIFITGEDSRNVRSGAGPEIYALVITGELELILTPRKLLQELDINTMFINEGIEMNAVVFDWLKIQLYSPSL